MSKELILIQLIQNLKNKGFVHFSLEKEWWNNADNLKYAIEKKIYFPLIYSKEFGVAMWGSGKFVSALGGSYEEPWHFHFQEMILMEDPLEYLQHFVI